MLGKLVLFTTAHALSNLSSFIDNPRLASSTIPGWRECGAAGILHDLTQFGINGDI